MSIAESILSGERLLAAAGIPAPRLESEVLLANRLGVPRGALIGRWHEEVGKAAAEAYRGDLARRAARVPLQYITGRQEFFSLDFDVDERVLIPRPETEMIVEEVLRLAAAGGPGPPEGAGRGPLIVDVGTGSGCIAIAIAVSLPACEVLATDLSPGAVEVARGNAAKHGVGDRIRFAVGDGLAPALEAGLAGRADFVVSNPPYIAEAELEGLQAELRHEPRMALSPGRDGLEFTARLIADAARVVRPGGRLLLELSIGRSLEASGLLAAGPWDEVEVLPDLQGIPRMLCARRRCQGGDHER